MINSKTIWLVNPYGPIEGENWREYSFNQFGKYLSENGFYVIWWTANFSHHFKRYRSQSWQDRVINENFIIRLVPTTSYKKNISFGRLRKDITFGKNALAGFAKEKKPDMIIAAENPMCMGRPAFEYAKKNNLPIIYDQMDIWPEFLIRVLQEPLRTAVNIGMYPVYRKRKNIYDSLDGAIALGKHYLEFMFAVAPALKHKPHALIYNGIDVQAFRNHLNDKVINTKLPSYKKENEIWCIFAGTLGPSYDIQGMVDCAEKFETEGKNKYKFIIAGSGPLESIVKDAERRLQNLIYMGNLQPRNLIPVYGKCDIGLAAYSSGSNVDMCDKFYDYTAAGLAVVNSLAGEVSEHIANHKCGINYNPDNPWGLYKAVSELNDAKTLRMMKENSLKAGEEFDMHRQNKKLLACIESVLRV